jgi:uncharacterized phage-associated protein
MHTIDSKDLLLYVLAVNGPANHLKLQKLLYYIEAWHLVFFDKSIIHDDFEAWVHGPVSRRICDYLKSKSVLYRDIAIKPEVKAARIAKVEALLKGEQIELIKNVLKEYGEKSGFYLESLTHSEDPWIEARNGVRDNERSEAIISKHRMKEYYTRRLDK